MKDKTIKFRLTDAERETFERAAHRSGMALSTWIRDRLRLASIRELRDDEIEFLKKEAR